jgi:hypothetical protein
MLIKDQNERISWDLEITEEIPQITFHGTLLVLQIFSTKVQPDLSPGIT